MGRNGQSVLDLHWGVYNRSAIASLRGTLQIDSERSIGAQLINVD